MSDLFLTCPKSGTHMMIQFFNEIHDRTGQAIPEIKHIPTQGNPCSDEPKHSELFKSGKHFEGYFDFDPNKKYALSVRDPRDCLISSINWLLKDQSNTKDDYPNHSRWLPLSFDEKLMEYITLDKKTWPYAYLKTLQAEYTFATKMMAQSTISKNILLVKFENLTGSLYGGNDNVRFKEMKKICDFFSIRIKDSQLNDILLELDQGKSVTFNPEAPKKIGQWKKLFKPEHIEAFQRIWEEHVINLGYERTFNPQTTAEPVSIRG